MRAHSDLTTYHQKRDFRKTSEPFGKVGKPPTKHKKLRYVVQRHEASRLHFDFRLELDGVLKSWAVPKEPSLNPKDKRLAVEVEDHPLDYASFEGDIPEGEYGAGHVDLWDTGNWRPLDPDPLKAYEKGKLSFEILGSRLRGRWTLVRTKGLRGRSSKKNWLLLKAKDEFADAEKAEAKEKSQKSGQKTSQKKSKAKARSLSFVEPQLAVLVDEPPQGAAWIYENKFDGYRILASVSAGKIQLLTRYGNDWSKKFAAVSDALGKLDIESALFDGEVVSLNDQGKSDFQALQNSQDNPDKAEQLAYYVFDLLELNGEDLREIPLYERKRRLKKLLKQGQGQRIRYSEHSAGNGDELFASACAEGREGIICKRSDLGYRSGRSDEWLKVKCVQRQEFVVVGYTDPKGSRKHFGALLLATRESESSGLEYVGKVGTGFNRESLEDIFKRMKKLEMKKSPLEKAAREEAAREKSVHWLKPELVAEITFTGWTNDRILRHPSFEGLREDKPAEEVKVEKPAKLSDLQLNSEKKKRTDSRLTSPDKVLFSKQGITKRELAAYYERVSELMLPHVLNRPLTLIRCPRGKEKACFFQKHYQKGMGPGIEPVFVKEKTKNASHSVIASEEGLLSLVQMGVLEIHTWGALRDDLDLPDQVVFDFDPSPTTSWKDVVRGLHQLKDYLKELKLVPFCKLSGSKGAHIHVPLTREHSWEAVRSFSEQIARKMEELCPETFTANPLKKERSGRLYLDYVRNNKGTTFVAPYSTRKRTNAPIAAPIYWEELTEKTAPNGFILREFETRLENLKGDPWKDFSRSAEPLPKIK